MMLSIRPRAIFDLVPPEVENFVIPVPRQSLGSPTILEQCLLVGVGHIVRAKQIFEFGTFRGRTTLMLRRNFPSAFLVTLDLDMQQSDSLLTGVPDLRRIKRHSCQFQPGTERYDLMFVDGGHDQATVTSDTGKAVQMLDDGRGAIVWHDYSPAWPGVRKCLDGLAESTLLYHIEDTSLVVMPKGWEV
jgi:hypothetical protein